MRTIMPERAPTERAGSDCPNWCITPGCSGEHSCTYGTVPATNGQLGAGEADEVPFPIVTVSLVQSDHPAELANTGVALGVHGTLLGEAEADLTIAEARSLRDAIDEALAEVDEA